jgi:hypothetical protein
LGFDPRKDKSQEEEKLGDTGTSSSKWKEDPKSEGHLGGNHAVPPPSDYSVNFPILMAHIVSQGAPPLLDSTSFENWQFLMHSHVHSSSTELWCIIEEGFTPSDPSNLSIREVVDDHLNATALHMINMVMSPKDRAHIRTLKTAKEA